VAAIDADQAPEGGWFGRAPGASAGAPSVRLLVLPNQPLLVIKAARTRAATAALGLLPLQEPLNRRTGRVPVNGWISWPVLG